MAEPVTIPEDLYVRRNLKCGSFSAPAGFLLDSMVGANANIAASKLQHLINPGIELFAPATSVAAATKLAYVARGAGELLIARAFISVVASDVSRTVTVDLQKSTAGGAFATVFSGTIGFTSSSTARTLVSGTFSSTSYAAGDLFQWVVTVAGSSGTQATGLFAEFAASEATA